MIEKIEYLYGVRESIWNCLNYQHALTVKIQLVDALIEKLNNAPMMERDSKRITACLKARDFNEKLMKE